MPVVRLLAHEIGQSPNEGQSPDIHSTTGEAQPRRIRRHSRIKNKKGCEASGREVLRQSPSVLLFFIDGLGIGTRGPHNPLDNLDGAAPLAVYQNEERNRFSAALLFRRIHASASRDVRRALQARRRFSPA